MGCAAVAAGSQPVRTALTQQQSRLRATAARLHAARAVDVHDARVAARRLRSLLATFGPLLDERRAQRLRRQLREFARALTEAREADVRRDMLLRLVRLDPALPTADAGRLRAMLRWSCDESKRALRGVVATRDWVATVEVLGDERTLAALRLRDDAGLDDVLELVDRPWREADELLARPPGTAAKLHRLRLALKRCRYALESVSNLQPEQAEQALGRLRSAQDCLGEHRDAAQVRAWVSANQDRLGRELVRRLDRMLRKRQQALKDEAIERAARVLPEYATWRRATRELRKATGPARDRA